MRQPARLLRVLLIFFMVGFAARAHADDRTEARAHYQAGVKFYAAGDYRGAIREFSAAQQLVPADLNNYNLALCYDKLGDAEPAVQYYRAFLDRQPNSDKRAEIEASIARLDAATKSAAAKKADEARKAEDARREEEARRAEEDARRAPPIGPAPPPAAAPAPPPPAPAIGPAPAPAPAIGPATAPPAPPAPSAAGSAGTPGSASPVSTGDSQLDRVNTINIDQIRDQRMGASGSGITDSRNDGRGAPQVATGPSGSPGPAEAAPSTPPPSGMAGLQGPGSDQPKKETPVYKKWWFWAVVAVSGYVAYQLATSSSESTRNGRFGLEGKPATEPGGLTLMRW